MVKRVVKKLSSRVNKKRKELLEKKRFLLRLFFFLLFLALVFGFVIQRILEGYQPSLISFSLFHFAGYLFFILMPVEALVPFYLSLGHSPLLLFGLALGTALVAEVLDYVIGYLFSERLLKYVVEKKRYQRAEKFIEDYGSYTIFFFNLFPLSSSVISLAAGMIRFPFRKMLFSSFLGLVMKYFFLVYLFDVFL